MHSKTSGRQAAASLQLRCSDFFLPQYFFGMPRKKYRNVVCCVGQQKKRASPRLLDMISESGIKSFPTGKKLEEKEEEEEEESRPSQFVVFLPTHLPEICLSFQLSRVNPIGTISTQRVERKLRHLIPRKRLIDKW